MNRLKFDKLNESCSKHCFRKSVRISRAIWLDNYKSYAIIME